MLTININNELDGNITNCRVLDHPSVILNFVFISTTDVKFVLCNITKLKNYLTIFTCVPLNYTKYYNIINI